MCAGDPEALARFVEGRDEAAFEELVRRHGPTVMGVCRRVLSGSHDTEDAFQATFLMLAQDAKRLRSRASLASWLYRVAVNASITARGKAATRAEAERRAAEMRARELTPDDPEAAWRELSPVLDEELSRLPERLRAVVVTCLIEGRPQREAARELGRTERTVRLRLRKARELLRRRLAGRGVAVPAALLATLLAENASAAVPAACATAVVSGAVAAAAGEAVAAGAISAKVASIMSATSRMMMMAKLKVAAVAATVAVLLAACGAITVTKLAEERPAVVEGNNAFALDLYARLRGEEGNLIFSPYSISTALAMTYAGARGQTASQMEKTLHFTLGQEKLHPGMADLVDDLNARGAGGKYELAVANRLWGQTGYRFLDPFLALNRTYYGAGLEQVDFARATEQARRTINAWVEERTRDKIKELLKPPHLTHLTRLVLTNAIYFKGNWASRFEKERTRDAPFRVSAAEDVTVPTMRQTARFAHARVEGLQILEMPYVGDELSMVVLLPNEIEGLAGIEKLLSSESLKMWLSRLREEKVAIFLPRFKAMFGLDLAETLKVMGMPLAFVPGQADFSGMTDHPDGFYIGAVIHKAYVDVNEEGTEAAAATAVVMKPGNGGGLPVFRADHPFLFLIRDRRTGSILFVGRVLNPLA